MFDIFIKEKVITGLMLFCMALSIFFRILLWVLYQNMIKEADNMASTNNKMLKQCKLKFANCYQLSNGVANIPVFVDKFLNRLSFGHISYNMMYHVSGQAMLLSVVFSGVGICRCISRGETLGNILPFYIVSFLGLYLYFSVSTVADIKGRKRVLKINLVDYLENHLSPRIDVTNQDIEMLYGESIFEPSPGVTRHLGGSGVIRDDRLGDWGVRRRRRTVELMPIGNRLTPEEQRDLSAVTDPRLGAGEDFNYIEQPKDTPDDAQKQSAVTGEELEMLLKEFLTT